MSDEQTLYVASPSMFRNRPFGFVLTLLLSLVGIGIPILIVCIVESVRRRRRVYRNGHRDRR